MSEPAYDNSNEGQNCLGDVKVHFEDLYAEGEKNKTKGSRDCVYYIITQILFDIITLCPEYKNFMTNKCVCYVYYCSNNHNKHIMHSS